MSKRMTRNNREKEIEVLQKEQRGQTAYEYKVNTKRFWQKQQFGSASAVKRIDPKTMKVIEVIDLTKNDNRMKDDGWFNMKSAPKDGTVVLLNTDIGKRNTRVTAGYWEPETRAWTRVMSKTHDFGPGSLGGVVFGKIIGWRPISGVDNPP